MISIIIGLGFILITSSIAIFFAKGKIKLKEDLEETKEQEEINRKKKLLNNIKKTDANFNDEVKKIYELIVEQEEESISQIAKEAKCSYVECVTKIKYLKKKQYIKGYFIDHINGYLKKCSAEEEELLQKYYYLLCGEHLQLEELAPRVAKPTDSITSILENARKDIIYLINKELIVGVEYNEETDTLKYYDARDSQNIVSVHCPGCGAIVDIDKGSKKKCEYCNTLIKYKSINK